MNYMTFLIILLFLVALVVGHNTPDATPKAYPNAYQPPPNLVVGKMIPNETADCAAFKAFQIKHYSGLRANCGNF